MNHTKSHTLTETQDRVRQWLRSYQDTLTARLSALDGEQTFQEDNWQRSHLGHGRTRIITNGKVFEQGGVNFSEIRGERAPASLLGQKPELDGHPYWGAGVSLVLHPHHPHCPTVHLNYRYFEAGPHWWFGGGADLTPYYAYDEDCRDWHLAHKAAMDTFHPHYYPAFSHWCDEYFFNHHRNETRGIGGTFYDYQDGAAGLLIKADYARQSEDKAHPALQLTAPARSFDQLFAFQQANANAFLPVYETIINRRQHLPYSDDQRQFQLYRRGRYVEFNLLHDRGTLFGIQSKGRVESILMSLPPLARWQYQFTPSPGSREADLTDRYLRRHQDWTS